MNKIHIQSIVITAAVTALLCLGLFWLFAAHKAPGQGPGERKVAYWRAPMNPTEIYDKPGKSAMGMDLVPVYADELAGGKTKSSVRKIAYWRAPMNPTEIYDKPGKSAMGMDLVPVYEDELISGVDIAIDPVVRQNMGLRTAKAVRGPLTRSIRTYGHVTVDESRTVQVSPKIDGWVEELFINFTGAYVKTGDPLYTLYSPALLAAQEEYLSARKRLATPDTPLARNLLDAVARRLAYFDIDQKEIRRIDDTGVVQKTLIVRSPVTGYVIDKKVEKGAFTKAGQTIFRISDLSRVWVDVHIYAFELPFVRKGQAAVMTLPYQPGARFTGKVTYLYPVLETKTRDVVIRLEFDNPALELKPEMYADVQIDVTLPEPGITIPAEAVIRSGERNLVFVTKDDATFAPRDVTLGLELDNGRVEVRQGIAPGDSVVTSGQFLLDSESKLQEAVQKMMPIPRAAPPPAPAAGPAADDGFFDDLKTPAPEKLP